MNCALTFKCPLFMNHNWTFPQTMLIRDKTFTKFKQRIDRRTVVSPSLARDTLYDCSGKWIYLRLRIGLLFANDLWTIKLAWTATSCTYYMHRCSTSTICLPTQCGSVLIPGITPFDEKWFIVLCTRNVAYFPEWNEAYLLDRKHFEQFHFPDN